MKGGTAAVTSHDLVGMSDERLVELLGARAGGFNLCWGHDEGRGGSMSGPAFMHFARVSINLDLLRTIRDAHIACRGRKHRSEYIDSPKSRIQLNGQDGGTAVYKLAINDYAFWLDATDNGECVFDAVALETSSLLRFLDAGAAPAPESLSLTSKQFGNLGTFQAWIGDNLLIANSDESFIDIVLGSSPEVAAADAAARMQQRIDESVMARDAESFVETQAPTQVPRRRRMGV
jgi:hypothetical protein